MRAASKNTLFGTDRTCAADRYTFFGTDQTGASDRYGGENLKLFSGLFRFQLHIKIITCLEMVDRVDKDIIKLTDLY